MTTEKQYTTTRKFGLANVLLILGLGVLLCGEVYFGYNLHKLSAQQEQIKEDYSMSNNIAFGLFSVDQWRDRIIEVVHSQVHDFNLTRAQKRALQKQVEHALNGVIDNTIADIKKPQKSIGGKLKKFAVNTFVNTDEIHAQVPGFAKTIIDKVSSPESQARLKDIASSKINQLAKQTYDSTSVANFYVTKHLYKKYNVADPYSFNNKVNNQLAELRKVTYTYAFCMLACVAIAFALWLLMRKWQSLHATMFVLSLLFAAVLLVVGVTTTIIQVDARLHTFNFEMMGQKVEFINQVLFFQSKSLLSIVDVLIHQPKPDAVVIGSLILIFVIIFPILRLTARGIHIVSSESFAKNRVVRYLAFESGKWDMADVMVVGILMTYIGLNGILKSQLSNLNINSGSLHAITENNTSLQPGYFIFVGYVVFAFITSAILKRISPDDKH